MQQLTSFNFLWHKLSFFDLESPKTKSLVLLIEFQHIIFLVLLFICGALFYLLFNKNLYSYLKYFFILKFVLILSLFFQSRIFEEKEEKTQGILIGAGLTIIGSILLYNIIKSYKRGGGNASECRRCGCKMFIEHPKECEVVYFEKCNPFLVYVKLPRSDYMRIVIPRFAEWYLPEIRLHILSFSKHIVGYGQWFTIFRSYKRLFDNYSVCKKCITTLVHQIAWLNLVYYIFNPFEAVKVYHKIIKVFL
jgi:hypothetical protein